MFDLFVAIKGMQEEAKRTRDQEASMKRAQRG